MKNRKNVLIVFAVLAILCLGIGYAALTDKLVMTGTITTGQASVEEEARFDIDWVEFGEPSMINGNVSFVPGAIDNDADTASFTISGFAAKGDSLWVLASFKNVSPDELNAAVTLTLEVEGEGKDKFQIASYITSGDADKDAYTDLAYDEVGYITIAVSLNETLLTGENPTLTITATLNAVDAAE